MCGLAFISTDAGKHSEELAIGSACDVASISKDSQRDS
jgi:hypothetical protein